MTVMLNDDREVMAPLVLIITMLRGCLGFARRLEIFGLLELPRKT